MPAKSSSTKAIEDRIRGAGLRCTRARVAVLGQLLQATGPLTHAEMADALADEGYDRATIYRNLTELTEAQLATRVDLGDHVWRFELKRHHAEGGLGEDHPHFVCTTCGEVSCLDDVKVAITPKPGGEAAATRPPAGKQATGKPTGIRAVTEVLLKGQCENCSED